MTTATATRDVLDCLRAALHQGADSVTRDDVDHVKRLLRGLPTGQAQAALAMILKSEGLLGTLLSAEICSVYRRIKG